MTAKRRKSKTKDDANLPALLSPAGPAAAPAGRALPRAARPRAAGGLAPGGEAHRGVLLDAGPGGGARRGAPPPILGHFES